MRAIRAFTLAQFGYPAAISHTCLVLQPSGSHVCLPLCTFIFRALLPLTTSRFATVHSTLTDGHLVDCTSASMVTFNRVLYVAFSE